MEQNKMCEERIVLSISLLVSNRIDTIRKCMESLKPILEAVPSELIAVDTVEAGKSDGSIDVVREYTENIVPFVWCDDFAAARNAGLERARGEWFMYIDDDEWLEDASPIISFFQSGKYRQYRHAVYTVRSYTNPEGTFWADTLQGRLFPIEGDTRFSGRIHEMVFVQDPVCELPCYAHHYGYAFRNAADREKHIERNVKLLEAEYEQNKGNLRIAAHLIQEYEGGGKFAESLNVIGESFAQADRGADSKFWHFLKFHEVLDHICLKEFAEAYEKGNAYLEGSGLLMGAEIGVRCVLAEVCEMLGKPEESLRHLDRYLELVGEIAKREDILSLTVLDMSQMWNAVNVKKAYARGVVLAYRQGDYEKTAYFIRKIDWKEEELQVEEGTVDTVFLLFGKIDFEPWMPEIMDAFLDRGFSRGGVGDVLAKWKPSSPERARLLHILALCGNRSLQVTGYRAEYAALSGEKELMCRVLQELVDNPEGNLLMLGEAVLQYLCKAEINGWDYVEKTPLYRWHICVGQWSREKELQDKRREYIYWRELLPAESLYLLDMDAAMQEAETMGFVAARGRKYEELHQSVLDMAGKFHQVYSRICHPDLFTEKGMFTALPPEAQFAEKYLSAAECLARGEEKGFVSLVKEAGFCYPPMGEVCRVLLEKYRDAQGSESREAAAELAVLIQMLKGKAERLWANGNEEEAKMIISQILQIQPDPELAERYQVE